MKKWQRRRAARRIKPGDGRPLARFRWWHVLSRSLFVLDLPTPGGLATHSIEVRQLGDREDGEVRARLYIDGALHAVSRLPARFPVHSGTIEVAVGNFGIKRCHHLAEDGSETQLVPHRRTAEGRRADLESNHPAVSRLLGIISTLAVLVGLTLTVPEIIEPISQIPPIADSIGTFTSPFHLPLWLTISLGTAAVLGSMERALRLRSTWLDDLAN